MDDRLIVRCQPDRVQSREASHCGKDKYTDGSVKRDKRTNRK